MKVIKKPVIVEAEQVEYRTSVQTANGPSIAEAGDWILTAPDGDTWPCKREIFERTYEPAEDDRQARAGAGGELEEMYPKLYLWSDGESGEPILSNAPVDKFSEDPDDPKNPPSMFVNDLGCGLFDNRWDEFFPVGTESVPVEVVPTVDMDVLRSHLAALQSTPARKCPTCGGRTALCRWPGKSFNNCGECDVPLNERDCPVCPDCTTGYVRIIPCAAPKEAETDGR